MALTPEQRTPPKSAQNNAKRGLELRKKWKRGGLSAEEARRQGIDSGVTRARQLSSGNPLSESTIRKMSRFNRHRRNYQPSKKMPDGGPTAGTIAWLLWGGTTGVNWAMRMVKRMGKSYSPEKLIHNDLYLKQEPKKFKVGDFVRWQSSGGIARGRITEVVTNGKINVPDSSFTITGTEDNPAALIVVYQKVNGQWQPSDRKVGHKFSALTKIDTLKGDDSKMEIKKLTFPFQVKAFEEEDLYFSFSGYAATFNNVDRGGDRIIPGAFAKTLGEIMSKQKEGKLPILWQHQSDMPLGVFTKLNEDPHGLYVEGRMPKSDDFVSKRVMPQLKIGSIDSMSIGYSTIDADFEDGVRALKEVKLFEVSLVTIPMNDQAMVTNMKSKGATSFKDLPLADRTRSWDSTTAEKRIREWAGAEDAPNTKYRQAFLWFDSEKEENFTSYKLPFADVINGRLTAIPRGVFAAAAALRGARGGVDIPQTDKQRVINHVKRYYRKMDLESPFDESASFRVDDLSSLNVREFETLARDGIRMSSKTAKLLASKIKEFLGRDVTEDSQRDVDNEEDSKAWCSLMDSIKSVNEM